MTQTIGAFLQEKMGNMITWLQGEGVVDWERRPSVLEATTFAEILAAQHIDAILARDFGRLSAETEHSTLKSVLSFVQGRESLHDKFWRYLELFSDTVSTDEQGGPVKA